MPLNHSSTHRTVFGALLTATTVIGVIAFNDVLAAWGMTSSEWFLLTLYTVLTTWIGASFWICVFGAIRLRQAGRMQSAANGAHLWRRVAGKTSPVAIVMPLHNEDAERSLSGLRATYESLAELGMVRGFHFFILSDSDDPTAYRAEETAWVRLCRDLEAAGRLFYRRRRDKTGKKAGNIQEFCERWGKRYDYMIILDADSIMAGSTVLEMVRRMDADPKLGLLQAWPIPANATTLFGRSQQFAAEVYGRLIAAGLADLMEPWATYWGHNAIIRTDAFMASCGLPRLSGTEPLGGEILSHDFVEAALLARRGWHVQIMVDQTGSYEEGPTNLVDHAQRDRRWCQGNLQHARLIFTKGLKLPSRLNFVIGIFSYCASPLWLGFMVMAVVVAAEPLPFNADALGSWLMSFRGTSVPTSAPWLIGLASVLLLGPKILGLAFTLTEQCRRRAFGGAFRLIVSVPLEILLTALMAPVMMMLHSEFVISILCGRTVRWGPQARGGRELSFRDTTRILGPRCLAGATLAAAACWYAPGLAWWMLPLFSGFALTIPLAVWSSRESVGRWTRQMGLLQTPSELSPHPILHRVDELRAHPGDTRDARPDPLVAEAEILLASPEALRPPTSESVALQ